MPIYNDNRRYLFFPKYRTLIVEGLEQIVSENDIDADVVGGVSTGGIPWGSWLADKLEQPFVYIRDGKKDYGLGRQIERVESVDELEDKKVLVVEDLISTGYSSIEAITAVRKTGAVVEDCLAIFDYELSKSKQIFSDLDPNCRLHVLLTYDEMLNTAIEEGGIEEEYIDTLKKWKEDPFNWWQNKNETK